MKSRTIYLAYMAPTLLVMVAVVTPLIRGTHTLYLRDTLNAHFEKKWVQAQAMREGYLPLVDPYRDGGQPLLGNPNSVALYPDNLLFLLTDSVAGTLWAVNAHFWIHLLLAPFAAYWLARSWGLRREASWVVGVVYVSGGFFLSLLNLFNLVAGAALAPALVAATIDLAEGRKRAMRFAALTLLWALMLLAGDPMTAAACLPLALSAVVVRKGVTRNAWWMIAGAWALGTVLALPQLVEFARVLPLTYRGYWGFSPEQSMVGSWNPMTAIELLIPFALGQPDLTFWGRQYFSDAMPLFVSLYPGLAALWLATAGGFPRRRVQWWSWGLVAVGWMLVLGGFNPLLSWIWRLPGASLLRLPIKLWLYVAIGLAMLAGVGFERLQRIDRRDRWPRIALGLLTAIVLLAWLVLSAAGPAVEQWLLGLMPPGSNAEFAHAERLRWAGLSLFSLLLLGMIALLLIVWRRRPALAGGLLVLAHLTFQVFFLRPAIAVDEVEPYLQASPLLELVPEDALVVQGDAGSLFGVSDTPIEAYPDTRILWLQRQVFHDLFPVAGIVHGREYAFSVSPEGLDSFLTKATGSSLRHQSDRGRVRLLAAAGVEILLLGRELDAATWDEAELIGRRPTIGGEVFVYRIVNAAPEVQVVGQVLRAPHLNAALTWMVGDDFDARAMAVLPEGGEVLQGSGGSVEIVRSAPEVLEAIVDSEEPGAMVVQRAFLPLYRASVDETPVPVVAANIHRIGVSVPAGAHRVKIWVDRRPLKVAAVASVLGLVALLIVTGRLRRSGRC